MSDANLYRGFEGRLAEMGAAARAPATLGEVWASEWAAAGLDTTFGVGKPMSEAYDELAGAVLTMTGKDVGTLARETGTPFRTGSYDAMSASIRDMTANLDQAKRESIEPLLDIRGRAKAKAAEIEKRQQEVSDRTYGLSGSAVGFLAGIARQTVDPVNLATLPLGAARGAGVLKMLGQEAGINFAIQGAQEPFIQQQRAALGLEAGFAEGFANAAEAGIGAAGLAGLFRAGGWAWRKSFTRPLDLAGDAPLSPVIEPARAEPVGLGPRAAAVDAPAGIARDIDVRPVEAASPTTIAERLAVADEVHPEGYALSARPLEPETRAALESLAPADFEAAALHVERDILIDRLSPDQRPEGQLAHVAGIDEAAHVLETGRLADFGEAAASDPVTFPAKRARPVQPSKPLSLMQYIARNGGLERTADTDYYAFDKVFVPGGGPLARKSGRSIDGYWREKLMEDGYLPKDADGYMSRDIQNELMELLQNEQTGQKAYSVFDLDRVADWEATRVDHDRDLEFAANQIIAAHREFGEITDTKALYEAAELMLRREVDDPLDALETAFVRSVMNDELPPAVKTQYALKAGENPFDAIFAETARERRDNAGSGGDSRGQSGQGQAPDGTGADRTPAGGERTADETRPAVTLRDLLKDPEAAARLADVERALGTGDTDLYITGPDGTQIKTTARAALDAIEREAIAAHELKACLGMGGRS